MKPPKKRASRARVRVETRGKHTVLVVAGKPVRLTPERCVELSAELIEAEHEQLRRMA
jgi:hypothetical protein